MGDAPFGRGFVMKHNLEDIWADGQDFVEKTAASIVAEAEKLRHALTSRRPDDAHRREPGTLSHGTRYIECWGDPEQDL
jgi:hypothetical protein